MFVDVGSKDGGGIIGAAAAGGGAMADTGVMKLLDMLDMLVEGGGDNMGMEEGSEGRDDCMTTDASVREIRVARAYDRTAHTSANIQKGNTV
jgi:hypothetical protein